LNAALSAAVVELQRETFAALAIMPKPIVIATAARRDQRVDLSE
jgi:hypothetical protein